MKEVTIGAQTPNLTGDLNRYLPLIQWGLENMIEGKDK